MGKPEFIITFRKERPDYIIVIECKASRTKHESKTRDGYGEYAVDGVLLYSSFLSKEYDVLSVDVSGEDKNNLKKREKTRDNNIFYKPFWLFCVLLPFCSFLLTRVGFI